MERSAVKKRITKQQKREIIERLRKQFNESKGLVIATQKGMTVAETTKVKKDLSAFRATYRVAKNRFLKMATETVFHPFFSGTTVIVSCENDHDVMPMIKYIVSCMKESGKLSISGGLAYGSVLTANDIVAMSKLPAREELIARLLSVLTTPVDGFRRVVQAPLSALLSILDQLRERGGYRETPREEGQPS